MSAAPKVLLVDDEQAARYGMLRALKAQNYVLSEAGDGSAALAQIQTDPPDVVISDINMPGMDGITLLRQVQQIADDPPLVVLITAYGSEHMAIEALRSGAHDYLSKPFELDELRAVVRNAVEKKRLLRENQLYYKQLQQALDDLKKSEVARVQAEKMASMAVLVAGVAHEINNPLGAIASSVDLIERGTSRLSGASADASKRVLEMISAAASQARDACGRIEGIVDNLNHFAQLDRSDLQRFQLGACVESTLRILSPGLHGIEVRYEPEPVPELEGSPRDINQIILNLMTNAIEAIGTVQRQGCIYVALHAEDGSAVLTIRDNGCGIRPEDLDRIFDPGFTRKGVGVGTGLGLAICYQIAKAHHGRIEVTSEPGEGSTFTVHLPAVAGG